MPNITRQAGPAILSQAGDSFVDTCRIIAVVWEGTTVSGNTAILRLRGTDELCWSGRTDTTETYQGINFGPYGIPATDGFYLSQISAGRVLVYIAER